MHNTVGCLIGWFFVKQSGIAALFKIKYVLLMKMRVINKVAVVVYGCNS